MIYRSKCYSRWRLIRAEVGLNFIGKDFARSFIFDMELNALDLAEDNLLQVHLFNELIEGIDDGFVLDKTIENSITFILV